MSDEEAKELIATQIELERLAAENKALLDDNQGIATLHRSALNACEILAKQNAALSKVLDELIYTIDHEAVPNLTQIISRARALRMPGK